MFSALMGLRAGSLRFTPAHPEDAARVLEALDPATLTNFSFFSKPVGLEDERRYLARMEKSPTDHLFLIEEIVRTGPTEERRLIGSIGLHEFDEVSKSARLGCIVFRAGDRGKGFGTKAVDLMLKLAFARLGLHKVYVQFFASRGTKTVDYWKGRGFSVEGTLRDEYLLNGEWKDMIRMSMLDREYPARPAQ